MENFKRGDKVIALRDCKTVNGTSKVKKDYIGIVHMLAGYGNIGFWFADTKDGYFSPSDFQIYEEEIVYEIY